MSFLFTLMGRFLLLGLSLIFPFRVALETESSSKNSSMEPQNLELERTTVFSLCDTMTMEACRILPHNGQFSYEFHTNLCW